MEKKTLGTVLKDARHNAGLTLKGVADKTGLTPIFISQLENDKRFPRPEKLKRIAECLSLNFAELSLIELETRNYLKKDESYTTGDLRLALARKIIDIDSLGEEQFKEILNILSKGGSFGHNQC